MKAWNSPKSTSASSPGRCSWPIVTPRACPVSSARTRATNARTVDSATCAPSSSHSRCHTRRAVWRCLRGAAWSSSSQRRTVTSCPPSAGASRSGGLRAGGTAHSSAWRTVRRCTRCRSASARMPTPSSRCSRRIRSNSSTLDISFSLAPMVWQPRSVGTGARGWGHFRPSLRPLPGPDQAVIPRWVHAQPYYRCSYPPEYRAATGLDLDHPRTVYLREADLLPHLDGWLAGLFDPASLEDTLAALEAASHDHTAAIQQLRTAEQTLADCQRQLAQYRAALDAGADPTAVTAWINQATASQAAAEAERARLRATPPKALGHSELRQLVQEAGGLVAALTNADSAPRTALYDKLGIEGVYQPAERLVVVTTNLVCQRLVSEGRYTDTLSSGDLVSLPRKALRQNPDNVCDNTRHHTGRQGTHGWRR